MYFLMTALKPQWQLHNCDKDHVAHKVKILGMWPFLEKVC